MRKARAGPAFKRKEGLHGNTVRFTGAMRVWPQHSGDHICRYCNPERERARGNEASEVRARRPERLYRQLGGKRRLGSRLCSAAVLVVRATSTQPSKQEVTDHLVHYGSAH